VGAEMDDTSATNSEALTIESDAEFGQSMESQTEPSDGTSRQSASCHVVATSNANDASSPAQPQTKKKKHSKKKYKVRPNAAPRDGASSTSTVKSSKRRMKSGAEVKVSAITTSTKTKSARKPKKKNDGMLETSTKTFSRADQLISISAAPSDLADFYLKHICDTELDEVTEALERWYHAKDSDKLMTEERFSILQNLVARFAFACLFRSY
jgi:hypothetical protein